MDRKEQDKFDVFIENIKKTFPTWEKFDNQEIKFEKMSFGLSRKMYKVSIPKSEEVNSS